VEVCNNYHPGIAYNFAEQDLNEHDNCPLCNANRIISKLEEQVEELKKGQN